MWTILLLLLLFYTLYIVARPLTKVWRTMHKMKQGDFSGLGDLFGQPGAQKRNSAFDADGRRKAGWTKAAIRKKKIGKDVGEYVKFSEITVSEHDRKSGGDTRTDYTIEQQITDIEWEDLP